MQIDIHWSVSGKILFPRESDENRCCLLCCIPLFFSIYVALGVMMWLSGLGKHGVCCGA